MQSVSAQPISRATLSSKIKVTEQILQTDKQPDIQQLLHRLQPFGITESMLKRGPDVQSYELDTNDLVELNKGWIQYGLRTADLTVDLPRDPEQFLNQYKITLDSPLLIRLTSSVHQAAFKHTISGNRSSGIYLAFIKEAPHPVAVKIVEVGTTAISQGRKIFVFDANTIHVEWLEALYLGLSGIGPQLYGVQQLNETTFAQATQVAAGEIFHTKDVRNVRGHSFLQHYFIRDGLFSRPRHEQLLISPRGIVGIDAGEAWKRSTSYDDRRRLRQINLNRARNQVKRLALEAA